MHQRTERYIFFLCEKDIYMYPFHIYIYEIREYRHINLKIYIFI